MLLSSYCISLTTGLTGPLYRKLVEGSNVEIVLVFFFKKKTKTTKNHNKPHAQTIALLTAEVTGYEKVFNPAV